eukprot:TRINITY_DN4442_c0_g1_i7.p1 TRINITY_DN4442_c0_g1~~TRINITY_DN4442_c0_g1_i7.p1  ORF type:complete len:723 (-),score=112.05 TRINITY_DN4442_c0_g1_i7:84-2252(-)
MRSATMPSTRLSGDRKRIQMATATEANRSMEQLWVLPTSTHESDWIAFREDSQTPLLIGNIAGYIREQGRSDCGYLKGGPEAFALIEPEKYVHYYTKLFDKLEHEIWVSSEEVSYKVGAAIIVCEARDGSKRGTATDVKALVFTKKGTERFSLSPDAYGPVKQIKARVPVLNSIQFAKLNPRRLPDVREKLVRYENVTIQRNYKFGVLYAKEGQMEENDMFNNETGSAELNEFLEFLGDKIPLKGFTGYTGGLDVKHDQTGLHSVHTKYENCEIMFHVSSLLQYYPADPQQIERKRHLGNDVVMIIFRDSGVNPPFDPSVIKSQFNHVFIVVTPSTRTRGIGPDREYKVALACKYGVVPFEPHLPSPNVISTGRKGRQWFLSKLINAERAAYHASEFVLKLQDARKIQLKAIVEDLQSDLMTSHVAALSSMSKKTGTRISKGAGQLLSSKKVKKTSNIISVKYVAKEGASPVGATLCLSPDKLTILDGKTHEVIEQYDTNQIKSWHFTDSDDVFKFDLGEHRPEVLVVITNKQKAIDQQLSDYIEAIISAQEARQAGRSALTTSAPLNVKPVGSATTTPVVSATATKASSAPTNSEPLKSSDSPSTSPTVPPAKLKVKPDMPQLQLGSSSADTVMLRNRSVSANADLSPHDSGCRTSRKSLSQKKEDAGDAADPTTSAVAEKNPEDQSDKRKSLRKKKKAKKTPTDSPAKERRKKSDSFRAE